MIKNFDYKKLDKDIFNDIQQLQVKNTPNLRRIRKRILFVKKWGINDKNVKSELL